MKSRVAFESAYQALNARQREAVDTIEGPVMVIAGPGTGKTQILTLRIANILDKTDTAPENILAVTFTESAASAMRARLVSIIGNDGYRVCVTTFHSFCNSLIQKYPEEFPIIIGSQQIAEIDQVRIIADTITNGTYSILKPQGDILFYVKAIRAGIYILKREGITPDDFTQLVADAQNKFEKQEGVYHTKGPHQGKMKGVFQDELKRIEKNKELADIYHAYQEVCAVNRWYDFDDMIMEVLRAFERNKDFLQNIQEKYQYVLIDEHQDTNNAQNKIITLLCNFDAHPNVFLVGDEKQAIFRFQGASFENFMRVKEHFPDTRIIALEDNYRSSQYILDAVHSVGERIVKNPQVLKSHTAHANAPIQICSYYDIEQELEGVAQDIQMRITSGTEPHTIAVLYRDNKDAYPLARLLEKRGIAYSIESDQDALADPLVRGFMILLQCIDNPLHEETMTYLLHTPYSGLAVLDVYTLLKRAGEKRISVIRALRECSYAPDLDMYENQEACARLYTNIIRWARMVRTKSPLGCIDTIARESGFMAYATQTLERMESLYKLKKIYQELERVVEQKPTVSFHDLVVHLESIQEHKLSIKTGSGRPAFGRVRLMTTHKSKGLEFDHVYVIHAYDGHWGNKRVADILPLLPSVYVANDELQEHIAQADNEDRKLFYVALTRAKQTVYISYARYDILHREQLPCAYIAEIREDMTKYQEMPFMEMEEKQTMSLPEASSSTREAMKNMVREQLRGKGLSVTALNNYLLCPWKYFYVNLLTVPQTQQRHQMYGTAIHATLYDALQYVQKGEALSNANIEQFLLDKFLTHLKKRPFSKQDIEIFRLRGEKALRGYVPNVARWKSPAMGEFRISGVLITDEVALRGVIDRMDFLSDTQVRVTDYKTGKHKSRADIEGKTKTSTGDIYRQLVFYKLLLNMYQDGKYNMESGVIEFIEPDEKGVYHQEEFFVTKQQTEELSDTVKTVISQIESLDFWDKRCEDSECEYCALRDMMQID